MSLDTQVIPRSIQASIVDTFKVMAQEAAEIISVSSEKSSLISGVGIVSVLGAKSDRFQGTIAIYFPSETYIPLMNKILGENQTSISEGNSDGASEFLNIIYGGARMKINEAGFNFLPAIPSTLKGQNLELPASENATLMKFNCKCGFGAFLVMVSLVAK